MNESDERMQATLSKAQAKQEAGRAPDFARVWAGAEQRVASRRRRRGMIAGSVAVLALAVVMLMPYGNDIRYIDTDELLETTSWSAPSDSLLPQYQFDIYGEIPVIIESTETYGGALL